MSGETGIPLDASALLEVLERHRVQYVVVGGFAAELHGSMRRTADVDVVPRAAPTLLIGGGPTSHIPQELLIDVANAVPNCTLITIEAGHDVHESEPDAFTTAVLDWLENDADLAHGPFQ